MTIAVLDLVDQPHLRIEVLAGASGLGRIVTWAHSSDLPEPWDWLTGGELLLKNGCSLPRKPSNQVLLLDSLAEAGISALVIGADPTTPMISRQALRRADELGLPLLQVPYSMSFIVISRAVADASMDNESQRIARTGRIYATIHAEAAGSSPRTFLERLGTELGCRLFVLDKETAAPVFNQTASPDESLKIELLDLLTRRRGSVPGQLHLSTRNTLVVEVPYEEPTLLVAEITDPQLFDSTLLQHAAAAVAVAVAHASLRQDHQRQIGADLLADLLDARHDTDVASRQLREHNIDPTAVRLLATQHSDTEGQLRLHTGLRRRGIDHLLLRRDSVFFVLLADAGPSGNSVVTVRQRLGPRTIVGISNPLGVALRAPDAAREAMWALAVAANRAEGMASYGDADPLTALRNPTEAQALVERILGPLLTYDRVNHSELVLSLAAFLTHRRSWQRTAAALHVHRQTVVYRMERVTQLTGRTLSETSDLAELWLAVSALEVLEGTKILGDTTI